MSETVTAPADAGSEQQAAPASAIETTAPETEAPQTVRDTASAVYDAIEAREAEEAAKRGPDGRFAAKPDDTAPEAAAQPEKLAPPDGFGDKAQVDWNRLPRSVQESILERVSSAPAAPPPDPYYESAKSLRGAFEQHGLIPERALPEIVGAWQQLVANPQAVLPELAKRFGVPWGGAQAQPQPAQEQDRWVDPDIAALRTELAELKAAANAQASEGKARQAAEEQRLFREVNTDVQTFAKDKSDFETLRPMMAAFIGSGQAKDLQEAYEQASWAHPQTRAARQDAERRADEQRRLAAAEQARKAASVNVRSDSRVNPAPARSIRETMERVADGIYSA